MLIHPTVYVDESLISYIKRICRENAIPESWLLKELQLDMSSFNNLNKIQSDPQIKLIAEKTGLSEETIRGMTINKYHNANNLKRSMPAYLKPLKSSFCPICIKEKNYHRIYWSIDIIRVCTIHNTVLFDKCPSCGMDIVPRALYDGLCSCGNIFVNNEPVPCKDLRILSIQSRIYEAIGIKAISESCYKNLLNDKLSNLLSGILYSIKNDPSILEGIILDSDKSLDSFYLLKEMVYLDKIVNDWPISMGKVINNIYYQSFAEFIEKEPDDFIRKCKRFHMIETLWDMFYR